MNPKSHRARSGGPGKQRVHSRKHRGPGGPFRGRGVRKTDATVKLGQGNDVPATKVLRCPGGRILSLLTNEKASHCHRFSLVSAAMLVLQR